MTRDNIFLIKIRKIFESNSLSENQKKIWFSKYLKSLIYLLKQTAKIVGPLKQSKKLYFSKNLFRVHNKHFFRDQNKLVIPKKFDQFRMHNPEQLKPRTIFYFWDMFFSKMWFLTHVFRRNLKKSIFLIKPSKQVIFSGNIKGEFQRDKKTGI